MPVFEISWYLAAYVRNARPDRQRSLGSNALASSIVLVCRPRPENAQRQPPVREFFDALEVELPAALDHLNRESHIAPVDLAQAAIGPGMQVYSRYSRVETIGGDSGDRTRRPMAAINQAIANYDERQEGRVRPAHPFLLGLAETARLRLKAPTDRRKFWQLPRALPSRPCGIPTVCSLPRAAA